MKKIWGLLLLSLGSLLLVGVLFLGIRLWLTNRPFVLYPQVNPLLAFSPKELEPSIALLPLAGYDDLQVFRKALEEGELETAYVTLAFSTSLEDQERLGGWISLAQAFAEKGLRRKALISYGQAYNVAILNPYFSDLERAEALIAIGKGLERMGEKERACLRPAPS
jgi:tetratricopeptide (TPR) repeat protein